MDKQAFKQRMQNLKSYRENNPGKGYWDWKVQAYQNGGDIPLWQQYQYSGPSYQDVLDDLKQNSPSTYNQLQQSKAADSQSSNEKNFIINYLIECLVDNQPFDCSSLGPNKYLNE